MLALYKDHLSTGQRRLAEQVLGQTFEILGGSEAAAERQRIRKLALEAKSPKGPLSDAFLDFLTKETSDG